MMSSFTVCIPDWLPEMADSGAGRDCASLVRLLADSGSSVRTVLVSRLDRASRGDANGQKLIVYGTRTLDPRRVPPGYDEVIYRATNAEGLHALSRWRASGFREAIWARDAARYLKRDAAIARGWRILAISHWEVRHYWRRLPRAQVEHLPYVRLSLPAIRAWEIRPRRIVSMQAAGSEDPIARRNRLEFEIFARSVAPDSGYECWQSPGIRADQSTFDQATQLLSARAVAILGPYGYGVKTTIVDAAAHGCWSIVHPALWARIPAELRKSCVPHSRRNGFDFNVLEGAPPQVHAYLAAHYRQALAKAFGLSLGKCHVQGA